MLEIAICDDDAGYIEHLSRLLEKVCEGWSFMIDAYHSGEELLKDSRCTHDLVFMDIQMDGMNGNVAARKLRERNRSAVLVFCSKVHRLSPESFKATPFRYLVKQHPDTQTLADLKEIMEETEARKSGGYLVATHRGTFYKFELSDIMYISLGRRRTSNLHLIPKLQQNFTKDIIVNKKLSSLYETIFDYGFGYAHNSYIVNFRFIKFFNRLDMTLLDDKVLTISRGRYNDFLRDFLEFSERSVKRVNSRV